MAKFAADMLGREETATGRPSFSMRRTSDSEIVMRPAGVSQLTLPSSRVTLSPTMRRPFLRTIVSACAPAGAEAPTATANIAKVRQRHSFFVLRMRDLPGMVMRC